MAARVGQETNPHHVIMRVMGPNVARVFRFSQSQRDG
jgi:Na+-transporting methylmalonyl-CoA/oxaloacetate decarboxylase beta subunit